MPQGAQPCMRCAAAHAVELVRAGCTDAAIAAFCGAPAPQPPLPPPLPAGAHPPPLPHPPQSAPRATAR